MRRLLRIISFLICHVSLCWGSFTSLICRGFTLGSSLKILQKILLIWSLGIRNTCWYWIIWSFICPRCMKNGIWFCSWMMIWFSAVFIIIFIILLIVFWVSLLEIVKNLATRHVVVGRRNANIFKNLIHPVVSFIVKWLMVFRDLMYPSINV